MLIRVVELRTQGARLIDICDILNAEQVATPGGGERWWPSHVHRLLRTYDAQSLMADPSKSELVGVRVAALPHQVRAEAIV